MDERELIDDMAEVEARIEAFGAAGAAIHGRSYAPGKWSGAEVIGHVADSSLVFFYRFVRTAAEGGAIVPFDQEVWAKGLNLSSRPVAVSLAMLRGIHAALAHHLRTLSPESRARVGNHPERGAMTPLSIATQLIRHERHHAGQLDAIREGRTWTKAEAVPY